MKNCTKLILTTAILATSGWADAVDFDTSTWTTGNAAYDAFGSQLTTLFGADADKFIFVGSYETTPDPDTGKNVITLQKVTTKYGGSKLTTNLTINGTVGGYNIELQNGISNNPGYDNHLFNFVNSTYTVNLTLGDLAAPESCYCMFYRCNRLESLDLSNFDTSNATGMYGMFQYCSKLTSIED